MPISLVTIEEESFYLLIDKVVERLAKQPQEWRWVDGEEAMRLLRIKSRATLQKMRDEQKIRFSQPEKKIILYDRNSIDDYLQKHAIEPYD
ncbi:MAG: helix-turn-helix domain-containing protein [Cyclobacteriaceae bacterium]